MFEYLICRHQSDIFLLEMFIMISPQFVAVKSLINVTGIKKK
jgi:hypothetical protein